MKVAAPGLLDALREAVGNRHVLTDQDLRAPYETDWTGRFRGRADAVVRPADTNEVVAAVRVCARHGVPVQVQGGNTGLVGGSVPGDGGVVLSLTRLVDLGPVDRLAGQVTVGAGTTLAALHAHARAAGFAFGVDFASRDSATIGGLVATNAGGVHVVRYGDTRAQVLGVQAVLADGRVLDWLPGLVKDNTGYHLPSLLCGSEGTLAVVTAVSVRLWPLLPQRVVALVGLDGVGEAIGLAARLRGTVPDLEALELLLDEGVELVGRHAQLPPPLGARHPAYLLVEAAGRRDPTEALAAALADDAEVRDAAVGQDRDHRERLWAYRERHTEAINAQGVPHKLDVTLPQHALADFERDLRGLLADHPAVRAIVFGHVGDGNLHVNLLGPAPDDETLDAAVLDLVAAHGGSISAEHGVGRAKTRYLHLTRAAVDVDVMAALKHALDPGALLNPGVLLPPVTRSGASTASD